MAVGAGPMQSVTPQPVQKGAMRISLPILDNSEDSLIATMHYSYDSYFTKAAYLLVFS